MNVAGPVRTGVVGSAPRSNSATSTVRSGAATGTFRSSRNENMNLVSPQAMEPLGLMICGRTEGCWAATFQPSGMPLGAGVVGHASVDAVDGTAATEADGDVARPAGPQATTIRTSAARATDRERGV